MAKRAGSPFLVVALAAFLTSVGCKASSTPGSSPGLRVSCPAGGTATIETSRWRAEVTQADFALRVVRPSGETLIETSGPLRFTTVTGQEDPFDEGMVAPWTETRTVAGIRCDATSLDVELSAAAGDDPLMLLSFTSDGDPRALRITARVDPAVSEGVHRVAIDLVHTSNDRYYGMGQRYEGAEHSGNELVVWTEEGCNFECVDELPTGVPIPFYLSSRTYGLLIDDTRFSRFDFGKTDPAKTAIELSHDRLELRVFVGDDPLEVIEAYTRFAGRIPELPRPWVFAPWISANTKHRGDSPDAESRTRAIAALMRSERIPTSGIWNEDWAGGDGELLYSEDFYLDETHYPDWAGMIDDMHALGFRVFAYFQPYLTVGTEDYLYAADRDYLLRDPDGAPATFFLVGNRSQLDLTNPDAVRWWQDTIFDRAARFGPDGWMNDFGEYVGATTISADGRLGWEVHNDYPRLWARTAREFWEERRPDGDWVFFSRSGYTGSWRYSPVIWTGDQTTDWSEGDGLPTVIPAVQSLGISGVPVVATDIGGLLCLTTPPTDRELFYRWTQVGAMLPVMREHNGQFACESNWLIDNDADSIEHWKTYATLHTALFPYLYTLVAQARDHGWPVVRHPLLHFPEAPGPKERQDDQFMMGDRILVAPVIVQGARSRVVYFPPGDWVHWQTGETYTGPAEIEVAAPLRVAPYFYRSGRIIPQFDTVIDTLVEEFDPDLAGFADANSSMTIDFFGEGRDELSLWDGTTIACDASERTCEVTGAPLDRTYTFRFH
jgi:alpha-glucosidase (family GH31 glycosyl hydrolase)